MFVNKNVKIYQNIFNRSKKETTIEKAIPMCSFLESKNNQKTFGATQAPNPGAPLAERGKGPTKNKT